MDGGLYQLVLHLSRPVTAPAGRLGDVTLPAGVAVYTGSAKRALAARVARHRRPEKPLRWHIDALTTHPAVTVGAVFVYRAPLGGLTECGLNQATARLPGARVPAPRFGATDCRARCPAHLIMFERCPVLPPPGIGAARVERSGA